MRAGEEDENIRNISVKVEDKETEEGEFERKEDKSWKYKEQKG